MDNNIDGLVEAAKKRLAEHDKAASDIPWMKEMLIEAIREIRKLEARIVALEGK
jgi:hypothetical protein